MIQSPLTREGELIMAERLRLSLTLQIIYLGGALYLTTKIASAISKGIISGLGNPSCFNPMACFKADITICSNKGR